MKKTAFLFILILSFSCNNTLKEYENEEFKAIQAILNEYLINYEFAIRKHYKNDEFIKKDSIKNYPILVSDALIPLCQIKEDNENLFEGEYKDTKFASIFMNLVNSEEFDRLDYREIKKSELLLKEPYKMVSSVKQAIEENSNYVQFFISRIVFDENYEKGIVYIRHRDGMKSGYYAGQGGVYVIEKTNNEWKYIKK